MYNLIRSVYISLAIVLACSTEILDNFRPEEEDYQVIRLRDPYGNLARTIIIPKIRKAHATTTTPAPPTTGHHDNSDDDRFILVSNSSHPPKLTPDSGSSDPRPEKPFVQTVQAFPSAPTRAPAIKRIRRRRRKKKPTDESNGDLTVAASNHSGHKNSKFLNLFTIVRFPNDECSDGGTCYTEAECQGMGGSSGMPCAKGYGVCCMLTSRCGTSGEINGRVFRGLGQSGVCSLTISKIPCAKQIRLDFIDFELEPPVGGDCGPERLLVTGQNRNSPVPILCGSNSGQHVYLDVDEAEGPVMVSVVSNDPKDFMIRVTQICDGERLLAPKHCLQYYTETEGFIRSFNYQPDLRSASGYLNNLDYAICIRKGEEMCSVMYSNEFNNFENPFDINNVDADGSLTVPVGEAGAEVFNCPDDFLAIRSVRLCGQKVNDASVQPDFTQNAPVIDSSSGPFVVSFVTDRSISGLGFFLRYKQFPC
ncbi:Hypothetical protein NTJ_15894 [Nesidiocoris tenuis]|uniref:CUB domain-containing protein n=1 Tax=Nesidiocoris tenuis TaxID=355587 RepID=A0ABN7BFC5_9HEMI|nr:Hypothetical protein NTJ_15894 [Nesidiocoris tenuis]